MTPRLSLRAISICMLAALLASGCGSLSSSGRKIDYRNTPTLPALEVPPDLANVPDQNASRSGTPAAGTTTFSGFAGEQKTNAPSAGAAPVLPQYPGVKLARDGQTRYVVVDAEPAAVWGQVREFLTQTGLSIANENARAGLLETDWVENRALVGTSESGFLSKWLRSNFSTGTRDKYHVRLERGMAPGTTEIYISHRGMEEVAPDQAGAARAGWKPRASDPELETEVLQRLVVHLGSERTAGTAVATKENAPAPAAPATPPLSARLGRNDSGTSSLALEDSLERAWRRVGLSLDRIGFTVEDRDRSKGIYYVRYIDPDAPGEKKGFFSRMFSDDKPRPNQFQVHVKPTDNGSSIEVLDKEGTPEVSKTGERILSLLYEQLK
jgi:outer membrane protein assembly factor BamC